MLTGIFMPELVLVGYAPGIGAGRKSTVDHR
jgi:hypothetical protein